MICQTFLSKLIRNVGTFEGTLSVKENWIWFYDPFDFYNFFLHSLIGKLKQL